MTARHLTAALVVLVATGCHRHAAAPPADPMLEALRAEDQAAGLTYAQGEGKQLFDHYCATCHGDEGKGDGQNASNLNPPVPDLTAAKSGEDAAFVRRVIAEGSAAVGRSPLSPPWGRSLSPQEIEYLTLYCQGLAPRKP
jgi:mono/diheme cytochrome c family protein